MYMDIGDLFFYGIIAVSVVASVAKSIKKRPEENMNEVLPDFKGSNAGKWMRTIFEDMEEKGNNFIPENPEPITKKANIFDSNQKDGGTFSTVSCKTAEKAMNKKGFTQENDIKPERQTKASDSLLLSLDLSKIDELKKAIIYSEIIRPKF